MAKEYDPVLCMMVDKTTKANDAKANDKLVKVPDNKLKEFEGILRSAGFKIVSKSDRGMTTHYQVEVNSTDKFSTEAELKEWAKKIDAACDKMDATAPTTWNIGLTTNGKITAGLDVREMYVKDSASVLDAAISTCDAASGDAMKQIVSTAKSWTRQYNQIFEKATTAEEVEKAESQKNNDYRRAIDYLDKIYNEVSQAYGHARNEIRAMFDEVGSNALKAYRRVTGGKK